MPLSCNFGHKYFEAWSLHVRLYGGTVWLLRTHNRTNSFYSGNKMKYNKLLHIYATSNLICTIIVIVLSTKNCAATLDLSNLDFNHFQFFRYQKELPNGEYQKVNAPPSSLSSHLDKTKAGNVYVQSTDKWCKWFEPIQKKKKKMQILYSCFAY